MLHLKRRIICGLAMGVAAMAAFAASPPKPSVADGASAARSGVRALPAKTSAGATIDFNRDIRTILSDNCFACHGPDENKRKAKLRLDTKEGAFAKTKAGDYAIVPGNLKESKLVERITSKDPDEVMPPPKSGKKLTPQQIDLLTRWIAQGAPWKTHWAFTKPERPALPQVKNKRWARNEIDYFVLARLEKEGLKPSPEADKTTLIRRATQDLTGLPPTPEEIDSFLGDKSKEAYEKVVDRLLTSPRYGEHMARYWLDAARYADSHGYHIDSERSMWKWREWVINAFNENMPFSEFTTEQLAGDLVPKPTVDTKIASGYIRNNMSTGEGGAITEEYQCKYTFDRTETTSTIWLGLTMTCCRCHTHKYDPITHKEYYQFYAFFNNLDESVMDGNKPNPDPFIKLPTVEQTKRQQFLTNEVAKGQTKLDAPMPDLDKAQVTWENRWEEKLNSGWTVLRPAKMKSPNFVVVTNIATSRLLSSALSSKEGEGERSVAATNVVASAKATNATSATNVTHATVSTTNATNATNLASAVVSAANTTNSVVTTNRVEFKLLEDESILVKGANPEQDVHDLTIKLEPGNLAALRLEALPHDSLPKSGSGRADDGLFRLSEIEAELITPGKEGDTNNKPKKLKFAQALADSQQEKNVIANAIDGKAETGWSPDPKAVGQPHTALFVLGDPMKVPTNAELRVKLRYEASKSKRAIGHFRLAAAQNQELVQLLNPPKLEPWNLIGPFKASGLFAGLTNVYPPETEIDLKKTYPGVREEIKWAAKANFEDGKPHEIVQYLHGVHGVYYLYRTINVPVARKMELSVKADEVFKLWVNGKLVAQDTNDSKEATAPEKAVVELKKGENKFLLKIVNHVGESFFTFTKDLDDVESLPADIAAIFATTRKPAGGQETKIREYYRRTNSPEWKHLSEDVAKWREENSGIEKAIPTTMVAKESEKPRETFMLVRGEYDKKGDKVSAGVPSILPPFPANMPTNRFGLAKWLLDPSHPLTARVTVNRFWQQYFGLGLVKTTEDFGVQGENPSHPELFDWLATEFMRNGWDIKRLQKLIVMSATYRQSSKQTPLLKSKDPENRLFARGPRFRLDAEAVRDSALAISGLLVDKPGGKSVKPYQPGGLWEAVSFNNSQKYVPDKGTAEYRRSIYTYWKRQSPPPNLMLFDAPTRETCTVRRLRTNTPLQALALMNDPQFVEASRAFAERIVLNGGKDAKARIAYAFRMATGRVPSAGEIKVLQDVLNQELAEYQKDKSAAEKLLGVGDFKNRTDLDKGELAAWTTIANMILNLDETITKG